MKIQVISRGIYGAEGELEIGSIHEVSHVPAGWKKLVNAIPDQEPVAREELPVAVDENLASVVKETAAPAASTEAGTEPAKPANAASLAKPANAGKETPAPKA